MKESEHLKLREPESTDFYNVDDFNYNSEVIDAAIKVLKKVAVTVKEREEWNGKADNQETTDEKAGLFSPEYKKKLDSIDNGANAYTLEEAGKELGGVKTTSNVTKVTPDMIPVPIVKGVPYYQNTEYKLNDMINGLPNLTDTPVDDDCYIAHGGQGKDYYRRPLSALWQYIKAKATEVFQEKGDYASKVHSHLYAGSESEGGKANSAKVADKVNWTGVEGRPTKLPASDVYDWAKTPTRPAYNKSDVGLGSVDNTPDASKSVNYATSAGKSSGIIDYGNTANTIQVGFGGSGASTDNLAYIAGYLTGGKQIKDVSKDVLKAWLGSMPANGGNADTLGEKAASYFATAQQVEDINSNLSNAIGGGFLEFGTINAGGSSEKIVTYSEKFIQSPSVVATINHQYTDLLKVSVYNITKTQCTVRVFNTGSIACNNVVANWIAICFSMV